MTADPEILNILRRLDSFAALSDADLAAIADDAEIRTLPRGAVLITKGEEPDALYLVLRGRFTVLSGGQPIAEIGMGEPVGEIGFFAGTPRSATVIAGRDSTVLALTRARYQRLVTQSPQLAQGILASLAGRLGRTVARSPALRPRAGAVCLVLDGAGGGLAPALIDGLKADFASRPGWETLIIRTEDGLSEQIAGIEATGRRVLLLLVDAGDAARAAAALAQADTVVLHRESGSDPALTALETRITQATLPANLHLALWHGPGRKPARGAEWRTGRPAGLHHNLRADQPGDIARLGRFLRGEALGMVLCGGGSYGSAHLGALKAMAEVGIVPDMLGGTSIGAAIAGALAQGLDPADGIALCEDIFLRRKAMSKYAVPRFSVLDHRLLDHALRENLGTGDIEDLPLPYFAVATSLTQAKQITIRTGPLWQAVRASTALPGIFQPFVTADGHVWIDGGLLDNTPVGVMRGLKPGRNVVLNFPPYPPITSPRAYDALPGRAEAARSLLTGLPKDAPPTLFTVLADAMIINSRRQLADVAPEADAFVEVPIPDGMSFLDWTRAREAFEGAYRQMRDRLDAAQGDPLSALSG